jgi:hypothetical protein
MMVPALKLGFVAPRIVIRSPRLLCRSSFPLISPIPFRLSDDVDMICIGVRVDHNPLISGRRVESFIFLVFVSRPYSISTD